MRKVLIVTGPGGDAQGWGDMKVTETMCETLNAGDLAAEIAYVVTTDDFMKAISSRTYDIVWSALYYFSHREDIIGLGDDNEWVADILDERNIPYIGPNALTMKQLIQKYETHRIMHENGVRVPAFKLVAPGDPLPDVPLPGLRQAQLRIALRRHQRRQRCPQPAGDGASASGMCTRNSSRPRSSKSICPAMNTRS